MAQYDDDNGVLYNLLAQAGNSTKAGIYDLLKRGASAFTGSTDPAAAQAQAQAQWQASPQGKAAAPAPAVAPPAMPPRPPVQAPFVPRPPGFMGPGMPPQNVPPVASPGEKDAILSQFAADAPNQGQAPQQPQQPQAPQGQAPQAPAAPQGMNQQGLYEGLINGGIGMMRGKNLTDSIANGLGGFNAGYDGKVQQDKVTATPKVIPLADGAFSMLVYPTGEQKVIPNKDVQKYLGDMQVDKTAAALQKIGYQGGVTRLNQAANVDHKQALTSAGDLQNATTSLQNFQKGLDIVNSQGGSRSAQIQGAPVISSLAGFFGSDDAQKNQFLQGLSVDATLAETAKTKGAISDKEMALFKSPHPSLMDDRTSVWKPWLEQRIAALKKIAAFKDSQVNQGTPPGGAAPASGKFTDVPGVSQGAASKYY